MYRLIVSLAFASIASLSAAASPFEAVNGVTVIPLSDGFSVLGDAGLGARGLWCAAADYAARQRGQAARNAFMSAGRSRAAA